MTFLRSLLTKYWFSASLFCAAALYLFFYPPIFAIQDEGNYLSMAYSLKAGKLWPDAFHLPYLLPIPFHGLSAPRYPLGNSILLLPFLFIHWRTIFILGLLVYLAGAFFMKKLAEVFKVRPALAVTLYLFFPAFILYSRTVMSDMPSMVLFLAAFYFYFSSSTMMAGLLLGLTSHFRSSNMLLLAVFAALVAIQSFQKDRRKDLFLFLMGAAPFTFLYLLTNYFYYGSPLTTAYNTSYLGGGIFSLKTFPMHLFHYLKSLNLCYPLMLIFFFFSPKLRRLETWGFVFFVLLFFSGSSYLDSFSSPLGNHLFSLRYLFPIIPFLILGFCDTSEKIALILPEAFRKAVLPLGFCFLIFCSSFIQSRHQNYLNHQKTLRDTVYAHTEPDSALIFNLAAGELLQQVWGNRLYLQFDNDFEFVQKAYEQLGRNQPLYVIERKTANSPDSFLKTVETEASSRYRMSPVYDSGDLRIRRLTPIQK